jgi:hypothetical protein
VALLLPDGRVLIAGGRSRSEIAPPDLEDEKPTFRYPGHYMLFVLNQNRVPSVGRVVRLE